MVGDEIIRSSENCVEFDGIHIFSNCSFERGQCSLAFDLIGLDDLEG